MTDKVKFQVGDKARIVNTKDPDLDGMICEVLGFTGRYSNCDYCIVQLPQAIHIPLYDSTVKALQMSDSCLEHVV